MAGQSKNSIFSGPFIGCASVTSYLKGQLRPRDMFTKKEASKKNYRWDKAAPVLLGENFQIEWMSYVTDP
jgi:hypothetical protein